MCMSTCRPQICQVFSSHDTLEAYQLVDDDLGRLVQWTLGSPQDQSWDLLVSCSIFCCWSCMMDIDGSILIIFDPWLWLPTRNSGRCALPLRMFAVRMVALPCTQIAGSSIGQWQGCCADECAMKMMKLVSWKLTFIYFDQVLGLGFGTADVAFSVWCRLAGYN